MKAPLLWTLLFAASTTFATALLACGDKPPPENEDGSGGNGDDPPAPGSSFTEVYAIFEARCVKCHGGKTDGTAAAGNLVLTPKADAYANLINKPAAGGKCKEAAEGDEPRVRVKPENPDQSLLLQKIKATHDCGDRMPLNAPTLTSAQIETIRTWIEEGALNPPS